LSLLCALEAWLRLLALCFGQLAQGSLLPAPAAGKNVFIGFDHLFAGQADLLIENWHLLTKTVVS